MGLLTQNQAEYYDSANSGNYGNYQFVSLRDIVTGFMIQYVGESKILTKANRNDVQYHAMRAIQEFSYDTFRSIKAQEITVPNTLKMILPQDYVNYTKLTRVGTDGIERNLYPTSKTSNPTSIKQDADGVYQIANAAVNRVVRIEVSSTDIADGDRFSLKYLNETANAVETLWVIADTDNNSLTGYNPGGDNNSILFNYTNGDTTDHVANNIKNAINRDSPYHTATVSSSTVTITYKQVAPSNANQFFETTFSVLPGVWTKNVATVGSATQPTNLDLNDESTTWSNFKSTDFEENPSDDYTNDEMYFDGSGRRYGLDPQHAQDNGSFYIDQATGYIHFGSNLAGTTIILHYLSDGLGTDEEMVVHKFAEEAVYKWIAYGIISSRSNMPEYVVQRFKKERFATARKAKIRLSNIKIEDFAQVLKGKSKPIK